MGNSRFNFDLYVDELLTEALSLTQMQDQLKQAGLDPTKYDQKHFLFLVGLINSNQGIEIYDELLSKIKDKGLLGSLMSVSVNDRRSDKPTIDTEKVGKALEHPDDPNELRAIIAGQRKEIPAEKQEPEYDAFGLKRFLSLNQGLNLFNILVKIKPELDNTLKQFLSEYNNEAPEVQEFLKTNAQRAKTVQDLIAILHEGHTKNINPFNSTTSLTLEDLQNGALFSNEEEHLYIIRTTYQDDFNKSIRWNLKYGQGNRFGLCISSRTNNYYVDYRTGEMGDSPLTTYFVYKLYDKNLDPKDINNYEIAIVDAMGEILYSRNRLYSFNKVATVVGRSQNDINSADQLKWQFSNFDVAHKSAQQTVSSLRHLFVGDIIVNGKDGKTYDFELGFEEIFKSIPLGEKEKNAKALLQRFDAENFLSFEEGEQMALLRSGEIIDSINIDILKKLSPQVRMQYAQLADLGYENNDIYNEFTKEEKNQYNKKVIKKIHEKIDRRVNNQGVINTLTNFNYIINDNPISILEYQIAITDPKLREIYVDLVEENNRKFREAILEKVDENGVYKGNIVFNRSFTDNFAKREEKYGEKIQQFFPSRYVLPDLSDIIVDGDFIIEYKDLTSLKGCPKIVTGTFDCNSNHITSLEGGPRAAFKYNAFQNKLISLKGAPKYVFIFNVANNNLTTLEHAPLLVGGNFSANLNKKLISLKGCPKIIGDDFVVSYNQSLESLEHGPEIVGVEYLFNKTNLKTLNGLNFRKGYPIDSETIREYQKLFDELNMNRDDIEKKTDLTQEDKRRIEEMKNETSSRIQEERIKASQEYKAKKQINKESLLYNLMKSYLLKS